MSMAELSSRQSTDPPNVGQVVSVRGSVVDACFVDHLPAINSELRTGRNDGVVIEVAGQLDPKMIRGTALNSTRGSTGCLIGFLGARLLVIQVLGCSAAPLPPVEKAA